MLFCQVAWDGKSNCENGWRILTRSWPSLIKGGRLRHLNPCAQLLATGLYKWQVLEIHVYSTFWCQKIASTVQVSLVFVNPEIIQHGSVAPQLFSQAVENVDSPQLHWASERLLTHKTEAVPTRTHTKKKWWRWTQPVILYSLSLRRIYDRRNTQMSNIVKWPDL